MTYVAAEDSIQAAIYSGIKHDITVNIDQDCVRAACILIYSGIDAIAYLSMPPGHTDVKAVDFIAWANRYIRFPGTEQLTGEDLYGARCSMLHTYGAASRLLRQGKCRQIVPVTGDKNEGVYPFIGDTVMVSVIGLRNAFFAGIDAFLIAAFADHQQRVLIESRLADLMLIFPISEVFEIAGVPLAAH